MFDVIHLLFSKKTTLVNNSLALTALRVFCLKRFDIIFALVLLFTKIAHDMNWVE